MKNTLLAGGGDQLCKKCLGCLLTAMPTITTFESDGTGRRVSVSSDKKKAHPAETRTRMRRNSARQWLFDDEVISKLEIVQRMCSTFHFSKKPFLLWVPKNLGNIEGQPIFLKAEV